MSSRPEGKNFGIFLNKELVAWVTPADAAAEKQRSAAALAERWSRSLTKAFEETKAQK